MADNLDTQVQIRIIDLAQEWMVQLRPLLPKSRVMDTAIECRIEVFDKLYKAIVKTITSE